MICYNNNGFSYRAVNDNYVAQAGEVLFSNYATVDQLNVAFSAYNSGTPIPTPAEIQKTLTDAVQSHMDTTAQSKGYDNLIAAITYADEPSVPAFQADGLAFRSWRSLVWAYCYSVFAAVVAGTQTMPTVTELLAELPALSFPK